jgi:hypothetical protein
LRSTLRADVTTVRRIALLALLLVTASVACGPRESAAPAAPSAVVPAAAPPTPRDGPPPTAKLAIEREMRADLARPRSPSDGGGRAWFDPGPRARVVSQSAGRLVIVYEVGPQGIAPGGSILLETKQWWFWSPAQSVDPQAPGYVTAETSAHGVELSLRDVPRTGILIEAGGVAIDVRGRSLRPGERVRITYGAGPALAKVETFAERGDRMWLQVDGDGDGVRGLVVESPIVDTEAGPPTQIAVLMPTTARVGETVQVHVSLLDDRANWCRGAKAELQLDADAGLEVPAQVALRDGHAEVPAVVRSPGVLRVRATGLSGRAARSNPLVVLPQTPRILWADLHGHSNLSDGSGTAEDYFRYARDIGGLDVAVLTDHDHVGRRPLDATPEYWTEIRKQVAAFDAPGRFVTLLGFEWTSWIHGHRHVLYFDDDGPVISSADPAYASPTQLWDALRGQRALTFAHHSAGGPIATNWEFAPDPALEPVTEIVSLHGSSEAPDAPDEIREPAAGNFVRDVLQRGFRLGFVGSGDSHDGHPGLTSLGNSGGGGLAAILSDDLTRDGVLEALRARRVYATNGLRIFLQVTLNGAPMGSMMAATAAGNPAQLSVLAIGESGFDRIDVIRGPAVVRSIPGEQRGRIGFTEELRDLRPGETVYVRAVQSDGGAAWSTPFFFE